MTESTAETDRSTDTDTEAGAEKPLSGLQAIWANTEQPVAPLPWYRRVSRKAVVATVVVLGLFTALTVAAVTGAGSPEQHKIVLAGRIGDQVLLPETPELKDAGRDFARYLTADRYHDLVVGEYGRGGWQDSTWMVYGVTGIFPDPRVELDRYFGEGLRESVERVDYPTGPLGGALECGFVHNGGGPLLPICVWADGSTLGVVIDATSVVRPEILAKHTLEIRAAVEVKAEG